MWIGIGIKFNTWQLFTNYSWIPEKYIFFFLLLITPYSQLLKVFHLKNLLGKLSHSEIHAYSLYVFNRKICSWILWKIFANRNNICQITMFANRNIIHELKLLQIGIGIYLWPKYQQIYLWQIYLQTICELFANGELFAVVVNKKSYIIKEMMNKDDALQVCESTCNECTSKNEVED